MPHPYTFHEGIMPQSYTFYVGMQKMSFKKLFCPTPNDVEGKEGVDYCLNP